MTEENDKPASGWDKMNKVVGPLAGVATIAMFFLAIVVFFS